MVISVISIRCATQQSADFTGPRTVRGVANLYGSWRFCLHAATSSLVSAQPVNLLVVDDDTVDVMNIKNAFQRAKVANPLYEAADGVDALAMLRGDAMPKERRLVLLDINMPRMSGLEFLRAVRADPQLKSLSVVILTTSNEERDRFEAYNLNVAGYLVKPVAFADFVALMTALDNYWSLVEL
jgi:CheY-like chemotaxis protein